MSTPIGPFDLVPAGTTSPIDPVDGGPPPELMAEIDAGVERLARLHALGRELHVDPDPDPDGGRVVVEVRDLDGSTLRTLGPSLALDVMTGL